MQQVWFCGKSTEKTPHAFPPHLYPHKSQAQSNQESFEDSFFKNYFSQKCSFTQFYPACSLKDHTKIKAPSHPLQRRVCIPLMLDFSSLTKTSCVIRQDEQTFAFATPKNPISSLAKHPLWHHTVPELPWQGDVGYLCWWTHMREDLRTHSLGDGFDLILSQWQSSDYSPTRQQNTRSVSLSAIHN